MKMKLNTLLAGAFIAAIAVPAMAQTTEYYVVQDVKTKHCQIVDKRPTTSEWTMVGPGGTIYHTRNEAESAMKTVKVCTTD
jgi:hypothetical protein